MFMETSAKAGFNIKVEILSFFIVPIYHEILYYVFSIDLMIFAS